MLTLAVYGAVEGSTPISLSFVHVQTFLSVLPDEKKRQKALRRIMEVQGMLALLYQYFERSTQEGDPVTIPYDLAYDFGIATERARRLAFRVQHFLDDLPEGERAG